MSNFLDRLNKSVKSHEASQDIVKTVDYTPAFVEQIRQKIDSIPKIEYKGKTVNISPSLIKNRILSNCDLAFFKKRFLGLASYNTTRTSAMNLGKRFEYLFVGNEPKRRYKEKYLKKIRAINEALHAKIKACDDNIDKLQGIINELKSSDNSDISIVATLEKEIEKIQAFEIEFDYVVSPILLKNGNAAAAENRLTITSEFAKVLYKEHFGHDVSEAEADVTWQYGSLKGILDLFFERVVLDVKYSGLIDGKFSMMAFNTNPYDKNTISKNKYQLAQPLLYTILALLNGIESPTFYYLVFDNRSKKEESHKFIKIQPSNQSLLDFADELIQFAIDVNAMIEDEPKSTDKSYVCAKCQFKEKCSSAIAETKKTASNYHEITI